jgi:hypothetical protein
MNSIPADLTESQRAELKTSALFNDDLAPVPVARRSSLIGGGLKPLKRLTVSTAGVNERGEIVLQIA